MLFFIPLRQSSWISCHRADKRGFDRAAADAVSRLDDVQVEGDAR
jgi:hypothetical protein